MSVVNISEPEGETVTRGSPYKFAMLNSPEISHLGKLCISPNGLNQLSYNLWNGRKIDQATIVQIFRHRGAVISEIPQKQY